MSFNYLNEKEEALKLDIRKKIHELITEHPGLHFRELQRRTDLATGQLEYHLHYLLRSNLLQAEKKEHNIRYYPLGLQKEEQELLRVLRQRTIRKTILLLLEKEPRKHKEFVVALGISPSSVSWYLQRLTEQKIIFRKESIVQRADQKKHQKVPERTYTLIEPQKIIKTLIFYKESFTDKLVDRFIETWEN
jgi:predicted transcriptional regulator